MPVSELTGKQLKHYGQDEVSKERYVVIALQNDTNPDTCSVIPYDRLDSDLRSELLAVVNSDECQHVPEIWKILDKKFFYSYPKQTMLAVLRALRQIQVVDQARVKIEITPDVSMTPKEIVNAINTYEAEKSQRTAQKFHVSDDGVRTAIVENAAQNEEIESMKTRITNMETQINTLSSNISDLISALKTSMTKNEE
jgi:hypothetical protein